MLLSLSYWTNGRGAEASLLIAARVEASARQLPSHWTHGRGAEASLLIAARVEVSARHLLSHWTHGRVAEASLLIAARVEASARHLLSPGPTAEECNYSVSQHIATRQATGPS